MWNLSFFMLFEKCEYILTSYCIFFKKKKIIISSCYSWEVQLFPGRITMFHLNRTYFIKFQTVFLIIQQTSVINFSHIIFKQTQKSRCLAFICKTQLPLWNQIKMNSGMKLRPYENKNKTSKQTNKKKCYWFYFCRLLVWSFIYFSLHLGRYTHPFPPFYHN